MTTPKNIFNGKTIRAEFSTERGEWLFSLVDTVAALSGSDNPRRYWSDLKRKIEVEKNELYEKIVQLKMKAPDGKMRETDALNAKDLAELCEHIKSAHNAAFIEWLATVIGASKKFILKHKDIDVVEIELDGGGEIAELGKPLNLAHLPIGTANEKGIMVRELKDWWSSRSIPASRDGLDMFLQTVGLRFPQQLLDKSFGLSLSDQYWICPKNTDLRWAEINFFHNTFSDDVGDLLLGNTELRDGQAVSLLSPDNTSDGMLKKKWKIIDGKRCLIKGSNKPFNQEIVNEVLASRICKRLGIPFVNYEIIELDDEKYSVCHDFIDGDTELVPAWRIKSLLKKDNSTSDYDAWIAKVEDFGLTDARRKIDMMLTLDFIIVNVDRHYNNFGLIRNANTLEWISVAPIYDSGTSMWCKDAAETINAGSVQLKSKPFRTGHDKQIKLVKDFSWLNLDALEGIESEFAEILSKTSVPSFEPRNKKLCTALRKRIELLKRIVSEKQVE